MVKEKKKDKVKVIKKKYQKYPLINLIIVSAYWFISGLATGFLYIIVGNIYIMIAAPVLFLVLILLNKNKFKGFLTTEPFQLGCSK